MKLYVGNLPYDTTEEGLRDWFTQAGFGASSVTVIRERPSGRLRGFGFVEIADDEEAVRAMLLLNGKDFLGRALKISEARPPREGGRGRGQRYW